MAQKIIPKIQSREPQRLVVGPSSTVIAAPSKEAREVVALAHAKAMKK